MAYDVQSVIDILRKFGTDMGLPKLNLDRLIEAQRENIDALGQAAQIAVGGAGSVVDKQREVLEAGLRTASDLARDFKPSGDPQEILTKQTEFAKKAFDITVQNARDVSGIATQSTADVVGVIRGRLEESLSELRSVAESNVTAAPSGEKSKK